MLWSTSTPFARISWTVLSLSLGGHNASMHNWWRCDRVYSGSADFRQLLNAVAHPSNSMLLRDLNILKLLRKLSQRHVRILDIEQPTLQLLHSPWDKILGVGVKGRVDSMGSRKRVAAMSMIQRSQLLLRCRRRRDRQGGPGGNTLL